jgi:energy-coupling factor transport system substrate-specific component
MTLASIISAAPIVVYMFGGITGAGTSIIAATLMAAGNNIWVSVIGCDGLFTVIDRVISIVITWLVIRVIPNRTLIKFGCGANYVKKTVKTGEVPAETPASDEKEQK